MLNVFTLTQNTTSQKAKYLSFIYSFPLPSQKIRFKDRDRQGLGLGLKVYYEEIQAMTWTRPFSFHPVVGNRVTIYLSRFLQRCFPPDRMVLFSHHSEIELDSECSP